MVRLWLSSTLLSVKRPVCTPLCLRFNISPGLSLWLAAFLLSLCTLYSHFCLLSLRLSFLTLSFSLSWPWSFLLHAALLLGEISWEMVRTLTLSLTRVWTALYLPLASCSCPLLMSRPRFSHWLLSVLCSTRVVTKLSLVYELWTGLFHLINFSTCLLLVNTFNYWFLE